MRSGWGVQRGEASLEGPELPRIPRCGMTARWSPDARLWHARVHRIRHAGVQRGGVPLRCYHPSPKNGGQRGLILLIPGS